MTSNRWWCGAAALALAFVMAGRDVAAQSIEMTGSRALGMGGAFVADQLGPHHPEGLFLG